MNLNKSTIMMLLFFLKGGYLRYLVLFFLIPMFLYVMNILFASSFGNENSFRILSSIGIWFSSPLIFTYIFIHDVMNVIFGSKNNNTLFSNSHISKNSIIISTISFGLILCVSSIFFSYFMTYSFTGKSISLISFFYLTVSVIPLALIFSSVAVVLGIYDNKNIGLLFIASLGCSFIQLLGNVKFDSLTYNNSNLFLSFIYNSFSFVSPRFEFSFTPLALIFLISIVFVSAVTRFSLKLIRHRNER